MTDHLPRSTPEAQGVRSADLAAFVTALEQRGCDPHSVMMVRHGYVVAEAWWAPYSPDRVQMLYSLSKTFVGLAVGMAVADGDLELDAPVAAYCPQPPPLGPNARRITVRHLLSMVTGHDTDTIEQVAFRAPADSLRGLLSSEPEHEPGTHFIYHNGASAALAAVVHVVTGRTVSDLLRERLFQPLGISDAPWSSTAGAEWGFIGLHLTTESLAKVGQLLLDGGVRRGHRLLPAGWVAAASSAQVPTAGHTAPDPTQPDWAQGYGYQLWRCRYDACRGDGAYGQLMVVLPGLDAVVVVTAAATDMQAELDAVWEVLMPAFSDDPLPPAPGDGAALATLLGDRRIDPPTGTGPAGRGPVTAILVAGDHVPAGTVVVTERGSGWLLRLDDGHPLDVPCGYGGWPKTDGPYVATGAWTGPDTFAATIVAADTPHRLALTVRDGRATARWNVVPLIDVPHLADLRSPAPIGTH